MENKTGMENGKTYFVELHVCKVFCCFKYLKQIRFLSLYITASLLLLEALRHISNEFTGHNALCGVGMGCLFYRIPKNQNLSEFHQIFVNFIETSIAHCSH